MGILGGLPLLAAAADPPILDFCNSDHFRRSAEYSAARRGVSLLVMVHGEIVFEDYSNGSTPERGYPLASGTKSITGVLAAAAIADGQISSWEEPLCETITEWNDDARSKITLRQLLCLLSGLDPGQNLQVPTFAAATKVPVVREPNIKFAYGPAAFQIFGEFLTRNLKSRNQSYDDSLKARLLEPWQITVTHWMHGRDGQPQLPSGAVITAREWAKFGELVHLGGCLQEQQLIPQSILDECFASSPTNPKYWITFWLSRDVSDGDQGMQRAVRRSREPRAAAESKNR